VTNRLDVLKNLYSQLEAMISVEELKASHLPQESHWDEFLDVVENILWESRHAERDLSQAAVAEGRVIQTLDQGLSEFYHDIVERTLPLIRKLYIEHHPMGWLEELLSKSETGGVELPTCVKTTIRAALMYWDDTLDEDDERRDDKFDFEGAWATIDAHYFQPDRWVSNGRELRPVLSAPDAKAIPEPVGQRLREIYLCFMLGNWLATVALIRSVLEYVILDNATRIGIDPVQPSDPHRTKGLRRLTRELANTRPDLEGPMAYIVKQGDFVMHPQHGQNVENYPIVRAAALRGIQCIRHVTEELYKGT
jgi:hypothetical protein